MLSVSIRVFDEQFNPTSRTIITTTDEKAEPGKSGIYQKLVGGQRARQMILRADPILTLMADWIQTIPIISTDRDQSWPDLTGKETIAAHRLMQKGCPF